MKILLVNDEFPPYVYGGSAIVVYDLAKKLKDLGHEVAVITTIQKEKENLNDEYDGIKTARIKSDYNLKFRSYVSIYNLSTVYKFRKILKEFKPDIVHFHNVHAWLSYYTIKIAKKSGARVFLTAHDSMLFHYGKFTEYIDKKNREIVKKFNYRLSAWPLIKRFRWQYNPLRNYAIRHYIGYCDKIFCISFALKQALSSNKICNVEVIHNGIDADSWQPDQAKVNEFKIKFNLSGKRIILFCGRASYLKGTWFLLQSQILVRKKIKNAVLVFVTDMTEHTAYLSEEAAKYGAEVVVTGWLDREWIKAAYHSSDVVVVPSIYLDPFVLVNIEAMASKKPVVGTCFGGTPEIIEDGKTGYIVNPLNTEDMAEKIIRLLEDEKKSEQLGFEGYKRVKEYFSHDKKVMQLLNYYQK
ncbi:glycosyltransferase family 1 protein [Candidatus Parcubacteria bacterium]|nr:MAG: glycosyltransferase family 1 protein [Candidatus Parcubacteria bacterium]